MIRDILAAIGFFLAFAGLMTGAFVLEPTEQGQ